MTARAAARLAGASWAGYAVLAALTLTLAAANDPAALPGTILDTLVLLSFATAGALVAAHRPANPIGWLFCAGATVWTLGLFGQQYGHFALLTRPGSLLGGVVAAWAGRWLIGLGWSVIATFLPLLFPDGHLPSPRWRPVGWLATGVIVLSTAVYMLLPGSLARGRADFADLAAMDNPFGVAGADGLLGALAQAGVPLLSVAAVLACVAAAIVRFRHATGVERQQLKWLAFAAGLLLVVVAVTVILFLAGMDTSSALFDLGVAGIPAATAIAILRYRLYDVDLVINRTLVYGALTACVVGIYLLVVGYLGALFQAGGSPAVSLVATGIVAVLFQPLRERLQRAVNRLLYGERPDPQVVIAQLGERLEETQADLRRSRERLVVAREEERRRLRRDLHDGLGPALASLMLKIETARNRLAHEPAADPLLADLAARAQDAVADVRRLVYALRPAALDDLGLAAALREEVARYDGSALAIAVDAPERLPPLPAAVEVAAYRIAQEALANVVRHAAAHTCAVRLALDDTAGQVRLEVADDGCGLAAGRRAGLGLTSMRERAAELGGTCVIESPAGGTSGTRVVAQLPLAAAARPGTPNGHQAASVVG